MTAPLRPMTLGEILDRTFQIYRSKFLVFATIAALPALVMTGIQLADVASVHVNSLVHPVRQPAITIWNFIVGLGLYHIASFIGLVIQPAFVNQTSGSVLGESC